MPAFRVAAAPDSRDKGALVVTMHDIFDREGFRARYLDPDVWGLRQLGRTADIIVVHSQIEVERLRAKATKMGKEIFATALHDWSRRCDHRLVAVNCASEGCPPLRPEAFVAKRMGEAGPRTAWLAVGISTVRTVTAD